MVSGGIVAGMTWDTRELGGGDDKSTFGDPEYETILAVADVIDDQVFLHIT